MSTEWVTHPDDAAGRGEIDERLNIPINDPPNDDDQKRLLTELIWQAHHERNGFLNQYRLPFRVSTKVDTAHFCNCCKEPIIDPVWFQCKNCEVLDLCDSCLLKRVTKIGV